MRMDNAFSRLVLCGACLLFAGGNVTFGQEIGNFKDLLGQGGTLGGSSSGSIEVEAKLLAAEIKPGAEAFLAIHVKLPQGFYIYSTNPGFSGMTKIAVQSTDDLKVIDEAFLSDHPPKAMFDTVLKTDVEKFFGEVTWVQRYRIESTTASVTGQINAQYCSTGVGGVCKFLRDHEFKATLAQGTIPTAWTEAVANNQPVFQMQTRPERRGRPEPAEVQVELTPENAKPGEEVELRVTVVLDEGWLTYSNTMGKDNAAIPTSFEVGRVNGLEQITTAFTATEKPEIKNLEVTGDIYVQEVYHDRVTWVRRYRVASGSYGSEEDKAVAYGLTGKIRYQVCNKTGCRPAISVEFAMGTPGAEPVAVASSETEQLTAAAGSDPTKEGLVPFLIAAVVAGFAALLTPCVFPMIPITVSFFLKQSEDAHHKPITMAAVYCLAIIATFTFLGLLIAAVFGATQLNTLANNPWINLGIAGVLVFFGMNLLGLFEIRIPSSLLTWTAGKESAGGFIGVMFMAVTFTLVSFTCTFAFVGLLLAWAAKGQYYWPILGLAAFSAAFSLPFFFLALFPSYLQKLPKSGGWMNRVKVTLGMVECGAAFKFFSVADLAWNPVPMVFDFGLVMSAWVVISICTGMYLLNMFRLPHDTPSESVPVPQLAIAMTFLGLAAYLSVGLFAPEKPTGKVWEQIAAFVTPVFKGGEGDIGPYLEHDGLQYALDYSQAIEFAKAEQQPVFLDFTGVNCVNCRLMEGRMKDKHNRERLEKFVRVQLYTDNVPHINDRKLVAELLKKNRNLQENWFGDVTLPAYVVVTPDGKTVLSKFIGMESKEGEFAAFLDEGLEKWKSGAAGRTAMFKRSQDDLGLNFDSDGLKFALDYKRAVKVARTEQRPMLLDFFCEGAIGSLLMENRMQDKHNRERLSQFILARLYVDRIPHIKDRQLAATLVKQNRDLQEHLSDDVTTPAFYITTPDGKTVLSKFIGMEQSEGDFAAFLNEGLKKWQPIAARQTKTSVRITSR